MNWAHPLGLIVAVLVGAWLVQKWPALNVIGKVTGM